MSRGRHSQESSIEETAKFCQNDCTMGYEILELPSISHTDMEMSCGTMEFERP